MTTPAPRTDDAGRPISATGQNILYTWEDGTEEWMPIGDPLPTPEDTRVSEDGQSIWWTFADGTEGWLSIDEPLPVGLTKAAYDLLQEQSPE